VILLALLLPDAFAGAWTKALGEHYAKAGVELYGTTRFVRPGTAGSGGSYFGEQVTAYGEVGVLKAWPVQVNLSAPFVVGTHSTQVRDPLGEVDVRASTARLGDLRVAAQVALHRHAPISAAVELKVPLYANDSVGENQPVLAPLFPLPGDGQIDLTFWLGAGRSGGPTFGEAALGYRHRTEAFVGWDPPAEIAFVDGIPFVLKGGHRFGKATLLLGGVDGLFNVAPDDADVTRQYVSLSVSAMVDLGKGVAIEPRAWGEVWAKNTSQGVGGGLALSVRG
jgi:hypothetical protein